MQFDPTGFDGLIHIQPRIFTDDRGYFFETFRKDLFKEAGITMEVMQSNQSGSAKNVVRGLHLQFPPFAQAKLVRVISGAVLDVVVDVRPSSPTFGKYYKCLLDSKRNNMLYVPEGFAHGFTAMEDSVFHYLVNNPYNKESESGVRWDDPELSIDWEVKNALISEKDLLLPSFAEFKKINRFK